MGFPERLRIQFVLERDERLWIDSFVCPNARRMSCA